MTVVILSFTPGAMLVGAMDVGGQVSGKQRRSHFGLRVLLAVLAIPAVLLVLVGAASLHLVPRETSLVAFVVMLFSLPALAFRSSLLYRPASSPPDDADSGGGSDGNQPPSPPDRPDGGLPLPDADPGRWRVRDHRPDVATRAAAVHLRKDPGRRRVRLLR